jgi:hypothetical protein
MRWTALALRVIVGSATLIHRIRRDSHRFRGVIAQLGGVKETLASMQTELHHLNSALIAVPAMANEMNMMNRQMSVMSQSIGSTMGRMGSWLPWRRYFIEDRAKGAAAAAHACPLDMPGGRQRRPARPASALDDPVGSRAAVRPGRQRRLRRSETFATSVGVG